MNIAYIRVSTNKQNTDRQKDILNKYNIQKVFEEKASGKNKDRKELNNLLDFARSDDTIYIESFSRLARNTKDLISIVEKLNSKSINLVSDKEQIDTRTPNGKLILTIFGALAEFERDIIRERTKEGLQSARARGKVGGRKPVNKDSIAKALELYDKRELEVNDICKLCGISKPTLYKYLKERKEETN